jgi:hypothetical protein
LASWFLTCSTFPVRISPDRYPHINPTWEQRYWLNIMPQIKKALAGEEVAWIGQTTYTDKTRTL